MNVDQFDFELPEELIAQSPLPDRASSRLLAVDRQTGEINHGRFTDITGLLQPGDTLVLNDTRVIPARLFGVKKATGAKAELLLLKALGDDRWEALVRPGKKLRAGAELHFGADGAEKSPLAARIESEGDMGSRIVRFEYEGIFNEVLDKLGRMPLPPYIKEQLSDQQRYQTVYAKHSGSAAAPTAGLHFTGELLQMLQDKGVNLAYITLHVGLGTFRPVSAERIQDHHMHAEYYRIDADTADLINETKRRGGRVVAVGTTSCRALESAAAKSGGEELLADEGWTDIFIYPGYKFRIVDALLTNFHLPKSTLIMLVSAFAGRDAVLRAYEEAIERKYRFFSFGDAMFLH